MNGGLLVVGVANNTWCCAFARLKDVPIPVWASVTVEP